MRVPNITSADSILEYRCATEINGKWYIAKPMGFYGFMPITRLHLAWKVFIGKYDVLVYQEDIEPKQNHVH